jgi:wobble nucleotide-excising tRNase
LGGFTVDDFCVLALPDDLQAKLEGARKTVTVLRDAENIRTASEFESFALPLLPADAVVELLNVTLPEIEAAAVKAVTQHFSQLKNARAEQWVSEGMELAAESSSCPLCGQGLDGSVLIAHYQAYFSEAYRNHKTTITKTRETVRSSFDGDRLARLQRLLQGAQARHAFWSRYIGLPEFGLDIEEVAGAWVAARDGLLEVIDRKLASPLEALSLSPKAVKQVERYDAVAERIKKLSSTLLDYKPAIALAKEQASHGSLAAAETQVARLEAIERRHDAETANKCAALLDAKVLKLSHEEKKEEARAALNEHRKKVFGKYQTTINYFLLKFNADFRIDALKPSDAGGVTSSGYEFVVNKARIGLTAPRAGAAPQPSFGTALSSGDRTTLALAFFFTTLRENAALANTIVVLDDPASSLDDGRALATAQEIRGLIGRTAQVIVLSHARALLCQLWERADKKNTATLQIRNAGHEMSTLGLWDAETAAISEYDRLHKVVRDFAATSTGQPQTVAPALRMLMESFLRVAFVEQFPPGKVLGDFLSKARQLTQSGTAVLSAKSLSELDNLREYANQFHHDTSKTFQENLSNVNETQLNGYALRVIQFTRSAQSS